MTYQRNNKRKSSAREVSSFSELFQPQIRTKYVCNCMACNGKEVDGRTQKNHTNDELRWRSKKARKSQLEKIKARNYNYRSKFIELDVEMTDFMHK